MILIPTADKEGREGEGSQNLNDLPEDMQPLSQELVDVLQPAAAFAYYTGISFVKDSQMPSETDGEQDNATSKRSNSMDSSEDDEDDVDSLVALLEGAGTTSTAGNTLHDLLGPPSHNNTSDNTSDSER